MVVTGRAGRAAVLAALLAPGPAGAACAPDEATVLDCTARGGARVISMCIAGDRARYDFGRPGAAPELSLATPLDTVEHQPWSGVGRSIWEATIFRNNGFAYEVYISVDRMAEGHPTSGGVHVTQGETTVASVTCDPGSAVIGLWAMSDALEARGRCWDPGRFAWGACGD